MMKELDVPSKLHTISQEKKFPGKDLKLSPQSLHLQAEAEVQNNCFNKVCKGI